MQHKKKKNQLCYSKIYGIFLLILGYKKYQYIIYIMTWDKVTMTSTFYNDHRHYTIFKTRKSKSINFENILKIFLIKNSPGSVVVSQSSSNQRQPPVNITRRNMRASHTTLSALVILRFSLVYNVCYFSSGLLPTRAVTGQEVHYLDLKNGNATHLITLPF